MSIQIQIIPGLEPDDVTINTSGHDDTPATIPLLAPFGIEQMATLQLLAFQWLNTHGYRAPAVPNFAWVTPDSPEWSRAWRCTGEGKAHRDTGHQPRIRLAPVAADILTITQQPTIIDHAVWHNPGPGPTEYSAEIHTSVSDTIEDHWDESQSIGISADVGVSVGPAEAKTSINYTTSWGRGGSKSETVDVGANDSITKTLQPGEQVLAALVGQRGTLSIEVAYQAEVLDGDVLVHTTGRNHLGHTGAPVNVKKPDGGHYPASWLLIPILELISHRPPHHDGTPSKIKPAVHNRQVINVGFFADANLSTYPLKDDTPQGIDNAIGGTTLQHIYP